MERRHVLVSLSALALALLAGCASVPMASLDDDVRAKSFTVRSGKANIYLYRNETFGGVVPMTVSFDGKVAAWSVFADNLPMRRLMSIESA